MQARNTGRYNSVAISLHWLIALLLVGLVVIAKVMNSLDETDPLRFSLIQWHKSFGILALLLVLLRVTWRLLYKPPPLPSSVKKLERFAAHAAHTVLYLLMLAIPISGWLMVSASPLNLKTELFGVIPWPHLPVNELASKGQIAELTVRAHHLLANILLFVVLLHIAAALRHQFFLHDNVLSRMTMSAEHGRDVNHGLIPGILIVAAGALYITQLQRTQNLVAGSSSAKESAVTENAVTESVAAKESTPVAIGRVEFLATQLGDEIKGHFSQSEISLTLDPDKLATASLRALVTTDSVVTGDGQIEATVVTADWFASNQYPQAKFTSTLFESIDDANYVVTGELTIRDVTKSISVALSLADGLASGEFSIDRRDFNVGSSGQDEFVEPMVTIQFEVSQ